MEETEPATELDTDMTELVKTRNFKWLWLIFKGCCERRKWNLCKNRWMLQAQRRRYWRFGRKRDNVRLPATVVKNFNYYCSDWRHRFYWKSSYESLRVPENLNIYSTHHFYFEVKSTFRVIGISTFFILFMGLTVPINILFIHICIFFSMSSVNSSVWLHFEWKPLSGSLTTRERSSCQSCD